MKSICWLDELPAGGTTHDPLWDMLHPFLCNVGPLYTFTLHIYSISMLATTKLFILLVWHHPPTTHCGTNCTPFTAMCWWLGKPVSHCKTISYGYSNIDKIFPYIKVILCKCLFFSTVNYADQNTGRHQKERSKKWQ